MADQGLSNTGLHFGASCHVVRRKNQVEHAAADARPHHPFSQSRTEQDPDRLLDIFFACRILDGSVLPDSHWKRPALTQMASCSRLHAAHGVTVPVARRLPSTTTSRPGAGRSTIVPSPGSDKLATRLGSSG